MYQVANRDDSITGFDVPKDALSALASEKSFAKIYNMLEGDMELRKYIFAALELPADTPFPKLSRKIIYGEIFCDEYYPKMDYVLYIANDAPDNIKIFYRNVGALFGVLVDEYSLCLTSDMKMINQK